jgi:DNA-binding CsgD family transcriptional regulator/tetratricopeptide (TPR) repeat protein
MPLIGRDPEVAELRRLLDAAADGRGGSLTLLGEPGIGKSAVLDAATTRLDGWRVLRATGSEFESDVPYSALHQLCAPVLDRLAGLPRPQRLALEAVFGVGGVGPDPLLVGIAVLGLLLGPDRGPQPVCCVVDDVQWVDACSRRVLAFVARRIAAEPVAVVFAARTADAVPDLGDLPRLELGGLSDVDAAELLRRTGRTGLDDEVRDRVVAEARGNPLVLLELEVGPWGLPADGDRRPGRALDAVADQFARRVEALPGPTRQLVGLAAVEPVGDLAILRRAATLLGLDVDRFDAAEEAGLVELGPRLRFRHPLVRAGAYRSTAPGWRRRAHAALAEATDPARDPDRCAWHRAHAVTGVDERVAEQLAASADRARSRGGWAAAAAMLDRAVELTPDPSRQGDRLLAAARMRLSAGEPGAARALVDQAERRPLAGSAPGEARLLRALVDFHVGRSLESTSALVDAAAGLPPDRARETYLEAFASAMWVDRQPGGLRRLALRIRERVPVRTPPRPLDLLLDALLEQALRPAGEAVPAMLRAVREVRAAASVSDAGPWWMELAFQMAMDLHDVDAAHDISSRQVELARRQGAYAVLPQALRYHAVGLTALGRFAEATAAFGEARVIDEAAGTLNLAFAELIHLAWRGDRDGFDELTALVRKRIGRAEVVTEYYATAVLANGLGEYDTALQTALTATAELEGGSYVVWHLDLELVEAAARAGRPEVAGAALARIGARAQAHPANWPVAAHLLARALLEPGDPADELYREAIDRLAETGARVFLARARLVYGEWLRRNRRRAEARVELRAAQRVFAGTGARAFADRAGRELSATGEHLARGDAHPLDALTAQERLIVTRVATGATSKEVAVTLFLSPRTIDAHLRNIYRKLGVSSRRQLRDVRL